MLSYCETKWGLTPEQIISIEPTVRCGKSRMILEAKFDAYREKYVEQNKTRLGEINKNEKKYILQEN